MSEKDTILTLKELAAFLKCSTKTVRRMIQSDLLPYYNTLTGYRFKLSEVLDAIRYVPEHLKNQLGFRD